jgi:small subunit ribosomal protein S20
VPNTKSAKKQMRQAERRRAVNRPIRTRIRHLVRDARTALAHNEDDAATLVGNAVKALDSAVNKGTIHRNAAARRKSRLMRRLNKLQAAS